MAKRLIPNHIFLENVSEEFVEEFINVKSGLPILLVGLLEDQGFEITERRVKLYELYSELQDLDDRESEITLRLLNQNKKREAEDFQVQYAVDFLKKYPQFKIMIEGVESQASGIIRLIADTIREAFLGDF